MAHYKTVNIDVDIFNKIQEIANSKKFYYRSKSDFIHSTLRDKLNELKKVELLEKKNGKNKKS